MSDGATLDGTKKYAENFRERAADGHFREVQGLVLSSLGIGTYLGQPDERTDAAYAAAIVAAFFCAADTALLVPGTSSQNPCNSSRHFGVLQVAT